MFDINDITPSIEDNLAIFNIVHRYGKLRISNQQDFDPVGLQLDLIATNHFTPLRLQDMLEGPLLNFVHDIQGIQSHINRSTGQLVGHFVPRYTKQPLTLD